MMAKDKKNKKDTKKKGGFMGKLKVLFLCIAAIIFLQQTVIMLVVGLLPSFVAYITDTTRDRSWFKTVFCCNLAGILPYIASIYFESHNSASAMQAKMSDFTIWLVIYGAAGFAWVLIWACPQIALVFYRSYYHVRAQEHKRKFSALKSEWSLNKELLED